MQNDIFEKFFKHFEGKETGFKKGSSFTKDLIKSRIELLELHKKLVKLQVTETSKKLTQTLRSAMENEHMDPELIKQVLESFNESTTKRLEKL